MNVNLPHSSLTSLLAFRAATLVVTLSIASFNIACAIGLHLHMLPNGRVVVHSHPVQKDKDGATGHQHSSDESAVLNACSKLLQSDDPIITLTHVSFLPSPHWLEFRSDDARSPSEVESVNKRAPPQVTSV